MWTKEQIRAFASTKKFAVVVASVVSAASGSAVGYTIAQKKLETKYAQIAEKEIEDAKNFYSQREKKGEFADPVSLAEKYGEHDVFSDEKESDENMRDALLDLSKELKYHTPPAETESSPKEKAEVKESIQQNIFENRTPVPDDEDEFDLEVEKEKREGAVLYILSQDEFFTNEPEYDQMSLTYFEGDDVLVDEAERPIRDVNLVVGGTDNLNFGYGSKDKNIVYIRNHKLKSDYEVARSQGKYAEEVLGFIEHSDKPRPRKFRNYD